MKNHSVLPPSPPVALVTGASDRIGAAIARVLVQANHKVVVHYRSGAQKAEQLCRELNRTGSAIAVKADLAVRTERANLVAAATAAFGPLTVLVNNASVFEPDSARDVDEALWDTHFALHAEAPVFLARDFAAQLPEGTRGNIVNIVDERVLHPSPAYFSYTLSKAVLWTATRTLAQTFAPTIRVNAVGPGPVMPHAGQSAEEFAREIANLPLQAHAGAQGIADAVLTLLNNPSMTGQMLLLDGGEHLQFLPRNAATPRR
ncbi:MULTISPECIES: SDR family oxidoreductase [unclassified Devosia]|uniref:SDR family oxidoreductase n=1 Tax=unclassified Devosia TaxID=196773 RepID=UPI001554FD37|nr:MULTISPECIES: SDR family oxidoreductase [unclassified Devosia]